MKILDGYIGKTIVFNIILVMIVLIALYTVISFAGEFGKIGHENYTILLAVKYTLLRVPAQIYEFFPLASLLGALLGLGGLANKSELVVIRSAGVSIFQVAVSIIKAALLVMLIAIMIGEFVAPPAKQYAQQLRVNALAAKVSLNTAYGLWVRDGENFVHVEKVDNQGHLIGISVYNLDEQQRMRKVIHARSAEYYNDGWHLQEVKKSAFEQDKVTTEVLPELTGVNLLAPDIIKIVTVEPDMLSILNLADYIKYLRDNGLDSGRYRLSFWNKLVMPFTILVMIMIAIPFVFGSMRATSTGARILVGFLVGISFFIINRISGEAGLVYHIHAAIGASFPTIIVFAVVAWMFRRVGRT